MVGLWGVAMLLAGLPACGSSSTKCTTNCNKDASDDAGDGKHDGDSGKRDAPADHGTQTDAVSTHDAIGDGLRDTREPVDLANTCAESLTAACAATPDAGSFSVHCSLTWDTTTRNSYLCARPQTTVLTTTCGAFRELTDTANNGSEEYVYIYNAAGDLVAVTHGQTEEGGVITHCVGGAPGFVDPVGCGTPQLFTCPKDGGTHG
jgi:hypothetical protein